MKRGVIIAWLLVSALALVGAGAQTSAGLKAKVTDAFGTAQKRSGSATAAWQDISVGDLLPTQTTVKTGDDSAVLLQLPDEHVLRVGANTTIELRELGANKSFSFRVVSGRIWSLVEKASKPAKYEVETPSAVAGVEGTLFSVFHEEDTQQTAVSTDEGQVNVRQGSQSVKVGAGYSTRLRRNQRVPPQVFEHPPAMKQMWQMMHQRETWIRPRKGTPMRLNRVVEQRMKAMPRRPGPASAAQQKEAAEQQQQAAKDEKPAQPDKSAEQEKQQQQKEQAAKQQQAKAQAQKHKQKQAKAAKAKKAGARLR